MAKYKAQIIITDRDGKTVIGKTIKPVPVVYDAYEDIYTFYVDCVYRILGDVWRNIDGIESD